MTLLLPNPNPDAVLDVNQLKDVALVDLASPQRSPAAKSSLLLEHCEHYIWMVRRFARLWLAAHVARFSLVAKRPS